MNLSNMGDDILLLDYDDLLVDAVSWGSSNFAFDPPVPGVGVGHAIERMPANVDTDTTADWQDQPTLNLGEVDVLLPTSTPTAVPSPTMTMIPTPFDDFLLISEVMYKLKEGISGDEWIEIYNATANNIDLTGFKVGGEETLGGSREGMFQFPDGAMIPSGQTIVTASDVTTFTNAFGFAADFEFTDSGSAVPDLVKYTPWASGSVFLANAGDDVLILDPGDSLIDVVSWGGSTWAFVPSVLDVAVGYTIKRAPADQDTDSAGDWRDQANPDLGNVDLMP